MTPWVCFVVGCVVGMVVTLLVGFFFAGASSGGSARDPWLPITWDDFVTRQKRAWTNGYLGGWDDHARGVPQRVASLVHAAPHDEGPTREDTAAGQLGRRLLDYHD
jgi:hypothetical protein